MLPISHIGAASSAPRVSDLLLPVSALATGFLRSSHTFPAGRAPADPTQASASVLASSLHAVDCWGRTRLMLAVEQGNLAAIVELLRAGVPVDAVDRNGNTALALAAHHGFGMIMETLVHHDANLEVVNRAGFTALMTAVHDDQLDTVRGLLSMGADPNPRPTSLQLAALLARPEIVSALVQAGASPYAEGDVVSPALITAAVHGRRDVVDVLVGAGADLDAHLHIAAAGGIGPWVSALLRVGANVNAQDEVFGHTALMAAAILGNVEVVNLLVRAGANVQRDCFVAAGRGLVTAVTALIQLGADVNATDRSGITALMWAAENGHTAVAQALVEAGANIQARLLMLSPQGTDGRLLQMRVGGDTVTVNGFTASMLAALHGHAGVVAVLRRAGADIDADLRMAAERGSGAMVTALAGAGANVNSADAAGITALMRAAEHGSVDGVNALLRAGANVHVRLSMIEHDASAGTVAASPTAEGFTALMVAALQGHTAVVTALRQAGADIDADLHMAVDRGVAEVVTALARAGANVNMADDSGITALMQAAGNGEADVVNALVQAGANVHARLPTAEHHGNAGASAALPTAEVDGRTVAVEGYTALMLAVLYGHAAAVAALRHAGADIDADLRLAAGQGGVAMVDALVRAGANIESTDEAGRTALMLAAQAGQAPVVAALMAASAQIQTVDSNGFSALMLATTHGHTDAVGTLLAGGATVNAVADNGFDALMFAAHAGNVPITRLLLQAGADLLARSIDGQSARSIALSNRSVDVMRYLNAAHEAHQAATAEAFFATLLAEEAFPGALGQADQAVPHGVVLGQASAGMGMAYDTSHWAAVSNLHGRDTDETMGYTDAACFQPAERAGLVGLTVPS